MIQQTDNVQFIGKGTPEMKSQKSGKPEERDMMPFAAQLSLLNILGIHEESKLALLNGTAGMGNTPLDLAIPVNGRFLCALDPTSGAIDMFQIERDGSLTDLGTVFEGLSIFAQGIAAR